MLTARTLRRSILLALTLLSACAASDAAAPGNDTAAGRLSAPHVGAAGAFLAGRYAAQHGDLGYASDELLKGLALEPKEPEILQQAFLAALLAGRPEAVRLAREQPDSPAAQLLLGDNAALNGNWEAAETRFAALPRQGITQVLQPMLVAWAQQGAGKTDAALATLKPFTEGQRFRAVYALHAALIADLASREADAARFYKIAQAEFGGTNLQLARMVASWEFRQGHPADAQQTIKEMVDTSRDVAIAGPAILAHVGDRQVRRATDGMAEAYLALAAALHAQDANDFSAVLTRLALDLRPDFTPARLLAADLAELSRARANAIAVLAPVPSDDPLIAVVQLRRVAVAAGLGNTDDALHQLESIIRAYPNRPEPYVMKGDLLRDKRRFVEAVGAYDSAIALIANPDRSNWTLFYNRGIALERSHQWPKAEADFQHALQLAPDQPFVLNYLGYSWAEQGRNLDRAKQMIQRAVEERPDDGSIIDSLGWVQLRKGDTASAVGTLERAVELDPEDATVNGHLGDAYWAVGRKLEAQFQWRRALNLNPEPEEVSALEAKLRDGTPGTPKPPGTAEKASQ